MRRRSSLLVCSGLILLTAHALAQENPYFPTAAESSWNYVGPAGEVASTTVVGAETYHGESVIRVDQLTDTPTRDVFVSYKYILDAAGNVFLAGRALPETVQDLNTIFSPFMLELPAPDEMQPSWQDDFVESTYFGDTFAYDLQISIVHVSQANEEISVPAGTFQTLRISSQWSGGETLISWYSSGIGVVQFVDLLGHTFRLTDYQIGEVSTEAISWGRLKSLYRN